jgi:hypothetical protein
MTRLLPPRVALLLVAAAEAVTAGSGELGGGGLSRDDFPRGFVFGAGTSAYQVSDDQAAAFLANWQWHIIILMNSFCRWLPSCLLLISGRARRRRTAGRPAYGTPSHTPVRHIHTTHHTDATRFGLTVRSHNEVNMGRSLPVKKPSDRPAPFTQGLFARVAEGSLACPLGPGLDWPGPNGAKHLVCVHVSPEPGRVQIVFAAILGAGLEANYLQLPN